MLTSKGDKNFNEFYIHHFLNTLSKSDNEGYLSCASRCIDYQQVFSTSFKKRDDGLCDKPQSGKPTTLDNNIVKASAERNYYQRYQKFKKNV